MKCNTINKTTFNARFTTAPYPRKKGIKLKEYLQKGIEQFELQTQNKPGCLTLRAVDRFECNNPNSLFYFWGNQQPPHGIWEKDDLYKLERYDKRAMTTNDFLKQLILNKTPKEQANIFESIFDALQIIPTKIAKKDKRNAEYMKNLSAQVDEKLGENKELLRPMFEHLKIQETDKKTNLTYDTIVF